MHITNQNQVIKDILKQYRKHVYNMLNKNIVLFMSILNNITKILT